MALRGEKSTAHSYDKDDQCIYCRMYKNVVDELSHVCTQEREIAADGHWNGKEVARG